MDVYSMSREQNFPPVVQILLDEHLETVRSGKDAKSWWTKITPELRRQAEWTVENYCYPDSEAHTKRKDFLLRVSGSLDPFSTTEICAEIGCRVAALDQFGRTVGLFADEIVIPDIFTLQCLRLKKASAEQVLSLIHDLILLNRLRPLIQAGVIRFGLGYVQYCQTHHAKAYEQIKAAGDMRELMNRLNETERERAWVEIEEQLRRFEGPNGLELPGEVLIGVGTK
jgi:hypothetical protein